MEGEKEPIGQMNYSTYMIKLTSIYQHIMLHCVNLYMALHAINLRQ